MQTKPHKKRDPVPLNEITSKGMLGKIMHKVAILKQLNSALFNILPANIRPHCHVVNIEGFQIIVGCTNSSIANAVYYQQNNIISEINRTHPTYQINSLRTKVSIDNPR